MSVSYQTNNPILFSHFFLTVDFNELLKKWQHHEDVVGHRNNVEVVFWKKESGALKALDSTFVDFTKVLEYHFCDTFSNPKIWKRQLNIILE